MKSIIYNTLILSMGLILLSCGKNSPRPSDTAPNQDNVLTFSDQLYTYYRDQSPSTDGVYEIYDTIPSKVIVQVNGDSISFEHYLYDDSLYRNVSFLITDSLHQNHRYMLATYRPVEYYQLISDSLYYYFGASMGAYASYKNFKAKAD